MTDDTLNHTLLTPIKVEGGPDITKVTFHEADLSDMIAFEEAEGGDTSRLGFLLQRMSNLEPEQFNRIKSRDIMAIKNKTDEMWGNVEEDGGKDGEE